MKNKLGMLAGFIAGVAGFLLLFKLIFLNRIAPSDELAPGIVLIAALLNGFLFAFAGSRMQRYIMNRKQKVR